MAKARYSVSIDADVSRRLDAMAHQMRRNRSEMMEILLRQQLDDAETGAAVLTNPIVGPVLLEALARPEVLRAMSSVIRAEMSSEQLELFGKAMHAAAGTVSQSGQSPASTPARAKRSKREKGRR